MSLTGKEKQQNRGKDMIDYIILIILMTGFIFIPISLLFHLWINGERAFIYTWSISLSISLMIAFY